MVTKSIQSASASKVIDILHENGVQDMGSLTQVKQLACHVLKTHSSPPHCTIVTKDQDINVAAEQTWALSQVLIESGASVYTDDPTVIEIQAKNLICGPFENSKLCTFDHEFEFGTMKSLDSSIEGKVLHEIFKRAGVPVRVGNGPAKFPGYSMSATVRKLIINTNQIKWSLVFPGKEQVLTDDEAQSMLVIFNRVGVPVQKVNATTSVSDASIQLESVMCQPPMWVITFEQIP